jgi:hypothetical protein
MSVPSFHSANPGLFQTLYQPTVATQILNWSLQTEAEARRNVKSYRRNIFGSDFYIIPKNRRKE